MTDLWESCPMKEKPTHQYYDLMRPFESATYKLDLEMWSFLEKVKVELDKIEVIKNILSSEQQNDMKLHLIYKEMKMLKEKA